MNLTDLRERGLFVTKLGGGNAYPDSLDMLRQLIVKALEMHARKPLVLAESGSTFPLSRTVEAYEALSAPHSGQIIVISEHQ
ncbi:hypothetical protein HY68_35885 [Streptomyces sp. AcH 505]|uniref:hypothetical protein n=1 Tax=Streptomyces sp. AcH 505 TaxID=352211 RepID=UPI0005922D79|nr:hypothetical protein HY68_35885 [Streptomyces sp. AcH 505]